MKDEVFTDKMVLKNGTILVSYHNGMPSLRLRPKRGRKATVEEFIGELRSRLLEDERIEIDGTSVNVFKTYGV